MGTHQELEMFGSQPAYPEKLLHKKESLQNQLINIRVELSRASTVMGLLCTPCPHPSVPNAWSTQQSLHQVTAAKPGGKSTNPIPPTPSTGLGQQHG